VGDLLVFSAKVSHILGQSPKILTSVSWSRSRGTCPLLRSFPLATLAATCLPHDLNDLDASRLFHKHFSKTQTLSTRACTPVTSRLDFRSKFVEPGSAFLKVSCTPHMPAPMNRLVKKQLVLWNGQNYSRPSNQRGSGVARPVFVVLLLVVIQWLYLWVMRTDASRGQRPSSPTGTTS
jgi:hypothetical protein